MKWFPTYCTHVRPFCVTVSDMRSHGANIVFDFVTMWTFEWSFLMTFFVNMKNVFIFQPFSTFCALYFFYFLLRVTHRVFLQLSRWFEECWTLCAYIQNVHVVRQTFQFFSNIRCFVFHWSLFASICPRIGGGLGVSVVSLAFTSFSS